MQTLSTPTMVAIVPGFQEAHEHHTGQDAAESRPRCLQQYAPCSPSCAAGSPPSAFAMRAAVTNSAPTPRNGSGTRAMRHMALAPTSSPALEALASRSAQVVAQPPQPRSRRSRPGAPCPPHPHYASQNARGAAPHCRPQQPRPQQDSQ